jgi:hypothetical protein
MNMIRSQQQTQPMTQNWMMTQTKMKSPVDGMVDMLPPVANATVLSKARAPPQAENLKTQAVINHAKLPQQDTHIVKEYMPPITLLPPEATWQTPMHAKTMGRIIPMNPKMNKVVHLFVTSVPTQSSYGEGQSTHESVPSM